VQRIDSSQIDPEGMGDLFDSTVNLEEQHVADGFQQGIE